MLTVDSVLHHQHWQLLRAQIRTKDRNRILEKHETNMNKTWENWQSLRFFHGFDSSRSMSVSVQFVPSEMRGHGDVTQPRRAPPAACTGLVLGVGTTNVEARPQARPAMQWQQNALSWNQAEGSTLVQPRSNMFNWIFTCFVLAFLKLKQIKTEVCYGELQSIVSV